MTQDELAAAAGIGRIALGAHRERRAGVELTHAFDGSLLSIVKPCPKMKPSGPPYPWLVLNVLVASFAFQIRVSPGSW